jgi:hypothetical protein
VISDCGWSTDRQTGRCRQAESIRILDAFHRLWFIIFDWSGLCIAVCVRCIHMDIIYVHLVVAAIQVERTKEATDG